MPFINIPDTELSGQEMRAIIAFLDLPHKQLAEMWGCSMSHVNDIIHEKPKKVKPRFVKLASDCIKFEYKKTVIGG